MENLFFDKEPNTWKELESMVNQAFLEMGYESQKGISVKSVRGNVNLDVRAIKKDVPIPSVIVSECKYWNKAVPQTVIQAFRTVCNDLGVHYGLIISKKGFQSGAKESRNLTNIHLLDFNEFQTTFFQEWRKGVTIEFTKMQSNLSQLYTKGTFKSVLFVTTYMFKKYAIFFSPSKNYPSFFINNNKLPVTIIDPRGKPEEQKEITINTHREYYEIAKEGYLDAIKHFNLKELD